MDWKAAIGIHVKEAEDLNYSLAMARRRECTHKKYNVCAKTELAVFVDHKNVRVKTPKLSPVKSCCLNYIQLCVFFCSSTNASVYLSSCLALEKAKSTSRGTQLFSAAKSFIGTWGCRRNLIVPSPKPFGLY
jgi:hypothetical protein